MFILQDGKLHIQDKKGVVGVDVHFDNVLPVKGTECTLKKNHYKLTALEVKCRFNINEDNPYIYPKPKKVEKVKKEVVKGATSKAKKASGKSK